MEPKLTPETSPVLAARTASDAQALDDARPLTALTFSAIRTLPDPTVVDTADAEGRRTAWASVGVTTDERSSRVLVAVTADTDEPLVLTLRQLSGPELPGSHARLQSRDLAGTLISVRENPDIVAAAATDLGPACPPLVCLDGTYHP